MKPYTLEIKPYTLTYIEYKMRLIMKMHLEHKYFGLKQSLKNIYIHTNFVKNETIMNKRIYDGRFCFFLVFYYSYN